MSERVRFRPFTGDSERKVHMPNAPLELVLAQVRWPEHARFARDFRPLALDFGDRLTAFPLFSEVTEGGIQVTPEGVVPIAGEQAYQWRSMDDVWCVHLTKRFISLFCTRHEDYTFAELQDHLTEVISLLDSVLKVRTIERIGIRYVNRVTDTELMVQLGQVIDPSVLGLTQLDTSAGSVELVSSFNQAVYRADEATLHVRSGMLSPNETVDPAVKPVDRKSWVLDLDAYSERRVPYVGDEILGSVGRLADVAYDFFKRVLVEDGEKRLDGAA